MDIPETQTTLDRRHRQSKHNMVPSQKKPGVNPGAHE